MSSIEILLSVVEAYRAATHLAEGTIGARFLGRGARVADLRAGGDMGARQIEKIIAKFSAEWPEGAAWPEGVERPGVEKAVS